VSVEIADYRLHRLGVEPLHPPQQRVEDLAPTQPGVELSLPLLHLPDQDIHQAGLESQDGVLDEQEARGRVEAFGFGGVDVAGQAEPHDVHVRDRLETPLGRPALNAELREGQVAAEAQVGLHQADADVHSRQSGRTRRAAGWGGAASRGFVGGCR